MVSLKNCVWMAKQFTKHYAENHVGRNVLEKECIKKGYVIKKLGGRSFQIALKVKRTSWRSLHWISTLFIVKVVL